MKTNIPLKVLVSDMVDVTGEKFDALLHLTIDIEDGILTLGSYKGPDLFRAQLSKLIGENNEKS
jgi:hypothetical protein